MFALAMSEPHDKDDKVPESGRDAEAAPAVLFWRWKEADRELFLRVKGMLRIMSNTDVLRFALGAAERELTRAGGSS
jgi:hypothetical protein